MQEVELSDTTTQRKQLRERAICVIIPTYNNAGTVVDVVNRAKRQCDDVIVVDDGCTDATAKLLATIDGINVVSHKRNKGKGAALRSGFIKARNMGFAYAITLDADGQHYPEDIPLFLEANKATPGALIVGARKDLATKERSAGSKFANAFSNFWFSVQTCRRLNDTQSGYRLYPLRKMHLLRLLTSRYEAELELLVFAAWHGLAIRSVAIDVYYPPKEERVSHFRPALDFTRISILNTALCVLALVYALPLAILRRATSILLTIYGMSLFAISALLFVTPLARFYMAFGGDTPTKQRKVRRLLHRFARFIMVWHGVPRVRFSTHKAEGDATDRPSIIICNHQSQLDLLALLSELPNAVFLTKEWVWHSPLFGYAIRHAGYMLAADGVDDIEQNVRRHLDNDVSVVIFPEGTRSCDATIHRFHSGAFHLARSLRADITPAVLCGAGRVLPPKSILLHPGIVELHFDARMPIDAIENSCSTSRAMASAVRRYYVDRYTQISNKVEQNV